MPTASENPETESYYLTQAALGAFVASQVAGAPEGLDPGDLAGSLDVLLEFAGIVGSENAAASIGLAVDYYEDYRASLGIRDRFRAPVIDVPTPAVVERRIITATTELREAVDSLVDEIYLAEITAQIQAEIEAVTQQEVVDAGRDQLFAAIADDELAKGWVRVTRLDACSFCRMLAMRGPVYSKASVGFRAHTAKNGRGGVCQCTAQPLLGGPFEATAQARSDEALWERIADEGFTGADARYEFRRHIEGREGGRRLRRADRSPMKSPAAVQASRGGFDSLTAADLRHQLSVLEKLRDTDYKRAQVARTLERLAALEQPA